MRLHFPGFLLIVFLICALPAVADTVSYSSNFSSGSSLSTSANYALNAFDSSLGTLNKVTVQIGGAFTGSFATDGPYDGYTGAPYYWLYNLHFNLGFGSVSHSFSSQGDSRFDFSGMPYGSTPIFVSGGYSYLFTFDGSSDLAGFTTATAAGPTVANTFFNGTTSTFIDAPTGVLGTVQLNYTIDSITCPVPRIGNCVLEPGILIQNGSVRVTYDYTPPTPETVPEPSSLVMLLPGAVCFALRRLRLRHR